MKSYFSIFLALVLLYGCNSKKPNLQFKNINYLKLVDSLTIVLDSVTYPFSPNIYEQDSVIIFLNEGTNVISEYDLSKKNGELIDFSNFANARKGFSLNSAGFINQDLFFLYSVNLHKVFFFDHNRNLKDSLQIVFKSDYTPDKQAPGPTLSPTQRPLLFNSSFFTIGYTIGEDPQIDDKSKFTVRESNRDGRKFYVNYPEEYTSTNWGGIYYRMVYNCSVGDTTMCISFPATSTIAIFNLKNKTVEYKKTYPDLNNIITPFSGKYSRTLDKAKIEDHYYGQYSFRGIIYDRYRKMFYRFLLKPTEKKYLKLNHMGPQAKVILVYDSLFNYLGCKELDETYSYYTYFVSKRGLYIQRIKNTSDESKIHFEVFAANSDRNK